MKRLVIILSIIAILGVFFPFFSILAQPTQVPHENPATATGSLNKAVLLLSYNKIFNLAASRQYQDARDVLNELRQADIPDELQYIIDRYSNLCQQLVTTLDNQESLLDEASSLLSRHQIHEAKQRLNDAETNTQDALFLREDIEAATDALSNQLGVFASPAASQVRQANARLEESMEQPRELIEEFNQLYESLAESHKIQAIKLIPTELSLSINPASVFVGDSITASGRLSNNGKPLAGRKLTLTLDDKPIATTTEIDGSYVTSISIPYKYVATMTITAEYGPPGDDIGIYLASQSPPATINTMFHRTLLEVSAPEIVRPGLSFTISGRVGSTDGNIDRTVKILLDDTHLAGETVPGQFSLEVTPPEQASTGKHSLTVSVAPQGRYSGASETRSINISRLPIHIDTQTPTLVILPQAIRISGEVYYELGPVPDARVSIDFKNSSSTARTSPDGSFTASVRTPLDLPPVEQLELTMTVTPAEPWYATTQVKKRLFTINPLSMELIIVAFIAMWILVDMGSRTRRREETGIPRAEIIELPAITPAPEPKHKLTGIKGRILSAYRDGLEAVEKLTGVGMAPHITLREFLKTVALLPPTATGQFAELTAIAESALYSAHNPRDDMATRAESLASNIKEELRSGTS